MRLRTVVVVVAALGLGVGPALAGGSSLREQANPGFLKAQTSIRSQVSGKWTKPLPAPCGTFLLPTQPCLYPYKGAQKLPQGIVMIPPIKLPPLPWLTLSEELLVATNVTVVPTSLFECKYTASGTAMGPYPGTFTQTGTAELTTPPISNPGAFTGEVVITSDVQTIHASVYAGLSGLPCLDLLGSTAARNAFYRATGTGVIDTDDGPSNWEDVGDGTIWFDVTRGQLSEVFQSAHDFGSINLPSSPCGPTGCH
jgi:hypothetical protein